MFAYDAALLSRIAQLTDAARAYREAFRGSNDTALLLAEARRLKQSIDNTLAAVKAPIDAYALNRHIGFIEHYLERGDKEGCARDIDDIVERDLPRLSRDLRKWSRSQFDAELFDATHGLVENYDLDSAVRRAFVILTSRLRRLGGDEDLDGHKLVIDVLRKEGPIGNLMEEKERVPFEKLLDGLYGVFRNKYGHDHVTPNFAEAHAILWTVNWTLLQLERIRSGAPATATSS